MAVHAFSESLKATLHAPQYVLFHEEIFFFKKQSHSKHKGAPGSALLQSVICLNIHRKMTRKTNIALLHLDKLTVNYQASY